MNRLDHSRASIGPQRLQDFALLLALVLVGLFAPLPAYTAETKQPDIDFHRDIRPILADHCFSCHGIDDEHRQAGLRLDKRDAALQTLESAAIAIVPNDPEKSELIHRVMATDETLRMPPKDMGARLTDEQVSLLKRWIAGGAPYAEHWAFTAPRRPELPAVKEREWPRGSLDHFILARLEAEGLQPSSEADRHTLIRRLSLDLRGLPPTPAEVLRFVNDQAPDAYDRLVDRFLSDSAYGERWARVWLDLARYADSKGYGSDPLRLTIWRYRDWVIDAFNRNLPFDEFTIEQIAGDMLPNPSPDQIIATAFHRNTMTNTEGGTDDEEFRVAAVKDRADTTGQIWMGLTFGCAKCHNHKYDPISQREYYQLYAFFNQTEDTDKPDDSPLVPAPTPEMIERNNLLDTKLAALRTRLEAEIPELISAQTSWENELAGQTSWEPWSPSELTSEREATLELANDGIVRVAGPSPANDVYMLSGATENKPITGLRLETLPDPDHPAHGAGRAADGNFVLSRIELLTLPLGQTENKAKGRFLRIELPGNDRMLSLAEVQVFRGRINLARDKAARQSSTDFGGDAGRAIDGNTDGHYFKAQSTTHTRNETNPWWEVDLGELAIVDELTIWNRSDGSVGSRLAGFHAVLLDESRKEVWRQQVAAAPDPRADLKVAGGGTVELAAATADFQQDGFPVANALKQSDYSESGWGVGPRIAEPHWAIFAFKEPISDLVPLRLTVRMEHRFKQPGYTLGQFRLSVTTDPKIPLRAKVPAAMLAIVDKPFEERTDVEKKELASYYRGISPLLDPVRQEIARLEKTREEPPKVPVMRELAADKSRKTTIFIKGSFLSPGEEVNPGVPVAFPTLPNGLPANRLTLAQWLVSPENPLTARVAVNRFWARLFGSGIVGTEEDFGTQGDLPTHPELLDWLATEFVAMNWDMKAFLKMLVSSATYRQSSRVTTELLEKDPLNRLYSRMSRSRLEAEMVRDQALALSGLLSPKTKGPSVFPPQPDGLWRAAFNGADRTWATSPGEDRYRRALYVFWRRTVPYPSMSTFDAPSREICMIRRNQTNTPLQALVTLNDPVFVEAAQGLARRIVREGGSSNEERARFGLELCLARPARSEQIAPLLRLYETEILRYRKDPKEAESFATNPLGPVPEGTDVAELAAWTAVANILLNLDAVLTRG